MAFAQLGEPAVAMETLVLISVLHEGGNVAPSLGVLLVEFEQLVVFLCAPGFDFPFGDVLVFLLNFHADLLAFFGEKTDHILTLHSSIKT